MHGSACRHELNVHKTEGRGGHALGGCLQIWKAFILFVLGANIKGVFV